ncbi:MAG: hypothetical protein PHC99_09095 [Methylococcales bacterium]|nr:hypothetical protein [Methylococcales bacterium]
MSKENPVVLIYKRTHKGDPDQGGIFGVNGCMGRVRNWKFDAVIGIGGKKPLKDNEGIANKISYVGLGAKKHSINSLHGHPYVIFDKFILFDDNGQRVKDIAPELHKYLYGKNVRVVKLDNTSEYWNEVEEILKLAGGAKPSSGYEHLETAENKLPTSCDVQNTHTTNNKTKGCCG